MINFNISLINPWGYTDYTATRSKRFEVSKNKSLVVECNASTSTLIRLDFTYNISACLFVELGLLGKNLRVNLFTNNEWKEYSNDYL